MTSNLAPPRDPSTGTAIPLPERESIKRTRVRAVRLIVTIPALMALLAVLGGILIRFNLIALSTAAGVSATQREAIENAADIVTGITIGLGVLAGLVGLLLALQIVRPLIQLERSMAAIAEGQISAAPVTVAQLGELGFLGRSFNQMVNQLQSVFEERDRQMRQDAVKARVLLDERGVVFAAEPALRRVLNLNPKDLIDRSLIEPTSDIPGRAAIPPSLLDCVSKLYSDAKAGLLAERQFRLERDGKPATMVASLSPSIGNERATATWVLELRDMTGLESFVEQMQRADRLAAVGTLATGIAHEIRNPLASIKGMIQLMAEERRNPRRDGQSSQDEYQRRTIEEVERLEKLVNAIMDFAQTEEAPPEPTDLNALLREVAEAAQLAAGDGAERIELRLELDPELPHATVQSVRMRQAFLNLALNAFQAVLESGAPYVRISTLNLAVNEERPIIITFANRTAPLPPEELERLFEPFYTTKAKGTGLGVPIAFQSIASNGGILEVEWDEGEILFIVRLPLDPKSVERRQSKLLRRAG